MVDFGGNTQKLRSIALCAALVLHCGVQRGCLGVRHSHQSESHSLIAGLTGAAIAIQNGLGGINMRASGSRSSTASCMSLSLGLLPSAGSSASCVTIVFAEDGPPEDRRLLPRCPDLRCRCHELHARCPGWPEVHRRAVPWAWRSAAVSASVERRRHPRVADDAVQRS